MNIVMMTRLEMMLARVQEMSEVHVPDYLDALSVDPEPQPDWDLLYALRGAERAIQGMIRQVATANRLIIESAWVGGPGPGAPLGEGPLPLSGG